MFGDKVLCINVRLGFISFFLFFILVQLFEKIQFFVLFFVFINNIIRYYIQYKLIIEMSDKNLGLISISQKS